VARIHLRHIRQGGGMKRERRVRPVGVVVVIAGRGEERCPRHELGIDLKIVCFQLIEGAAFLGEVAGVENKGRILALDHALSQGKLVLRTCAAVSEGKKAKGAWPRSAEPEVLHDHAGAVNQLIKILAIGCKVSQLDAVLEQRLDAGWGRQCLNRGGCYTREIAVGGVANDCRSALGRGPDNCRGVGADVLEVRIPGEWSRRAD
jgi:hypothetical protein